MDAKKKFCRRCHKERVITNKRLGWCRTCLKKVNDKYCYIEVLPHPPDYDVLLDLYAKRVSQTEIAKRFGRSRTGVQGICGRYTRRVDAEGIVRPR